MLIGTQTSISNATVAKHVSNILAQLLEITGLLIIPPTIEGLFQKFLKVFNIISSAFLKTGSRDNALQLLEHNFKARSNLTTEPRMIFHLLRNPIHQRPKPPRHLAGANAVPKSTKNLQHILIRTLNINPTKPLEEADEKVQHGVADLVLCDVRGKNAAAGDYGSVITINHSTLIPNELLKSLGQLSNKVTLTLTQSVLNLRKLRT
ncbi:ATPase [Babesia caballi]|uniref:ATPase n=1 Tax=Babesia caballi TaxID=5871 RepID=A0AAV4LV75_BABCB|nr:ATPase [Babesia caballi]